jgi:hypothetical protein
MAPGGVVLPQQGKLFLRVNSCVKRKFVSICQGDSGEQCGLWASCLTLRGFGKAH